MATSETLYHYLEQSAERWPERTAVVEPGAGAITYRALDQLSDRLRDRLHHLGVRRGDRVGIYLHKSIDSIAAIFGILKTGAAYVPVDPGAPAARNAYILDNCSVKVAIVEREFADDLVAELAASAEMPYLLLLDGVGGGTALDAALTEADDREPALEASAAETSTAEDLAYILYTSGSTGKPKGVMLSHRAAVSFVDWCTELLNPTEDDRFSSHAPFHFDLSIHDIYVPIKNGASVAIVSEEVGKDPLRLAQFIEDQTITIWYSTPSILSLLTQYGKVEQYDYSALRIVIFAGEVFPVKHLRALKDLLPHPRYFNWYGPTETNVCTWYEIPAHIPEDRVQPFPIGVTCSHFRTRVIDQDGNDVAAGEEGELIVSGAGMLDGYWNLPERTAKAFHVDANGIRWYKTGDVVIEEADGNYTFVGRRDRMVKKRGYRVELGEIEAGLYRHPAVREAAAVALTDDEDGVRIKAFLSCDGEKRPSLIEMKRFCAENLPIYMVPDLFSFYDVLPKTSTDKIDYQKLRTLN